MDPSIIYVVIIVFVLYRFFKSKTGLKSDDAKKLIAEGGKIIDVRSPAEFKGGHFKGAFNVQHSNITQGIKKLKSKSKIKKDTPLILYCASGSRSSAAIRELKADGYTNVHNAGTQHKLTSLLA